MPFWMAPAAGETPGSVPITLGHAGIMVGAPDAMMGFPAWHVLRSLPGAAQHHRWRHRRQLNAIHRTGDAVARPSAIVAALGIAAGGHGEPVAADRS